ncbi:NUDIX domain-containing protein [Caldalkalibacillus mannanilyticus]|uniref:NUDIX domain-containing protein n=1 Tax=Caldalkalibacillus mannanilyticus TaxID=1418 RepID=UPI000550F1BF|nr:NUDIX domain-containing protein [Caldalkalibacillus mannanilyticus]
MPAIDRVDVWLGVAGILRKDHTYLVVKKKYGGLKEKWSFPAGFVDPGETVDQAVLREVREETGIEAKVIDILGIRTGVIREKISDNMIVFALEYQSGELIPNHEELFDVAWLSRNELLADPATSSMIRFFLTEDNTMDQKDHGFKEHESNPGKEFGYSLYKIFKKE